MRVERLSILNFKNIEEAEMVFSPKMNCFFGNNGMGKTNLLDALFYLSFCKSYTNLPDSQLIMHDKEFCVLQGFYLLNDRPEEIYCGIKRKCRKHFKRNKKEYGKLSEHIGLLPLVMVSPSDTDLIQGGSDERRKFVDMIISQYDREYLHALIDYNKALEQRNALLKNELHDDSLMEILDDRMAACARPIHAKRRLFLEAFLPIFKAFYRVISQDGETVNLEYESQLHHADLSDLLAGKRDRDRLLGYSTQGIHKDDFHFLLGDYLMKKIGSQGQNKTYLIALKLAQFDFLAKKGNALPVLLLDDIFDKLDALRVEQIVKLVSGDTFGQIFITDTNREHLDEILHKMNHDYRLFYVDRGLIKELEPHP
ncbi:MAG: DNA replication and repair protein RecF [Dysgonamonadaceae bacterium]|jgi:DNA replication and repair protein RecF|nr:DNA replication and repair protein RecF [Dysgonamonadaceae bacterium]